jgi:hypothetical protein
LGGCGSWGIEKLGYGVKGGGCIMSRWKVDGSGSSGGERKFVKAEAYMCVTYIIGCLFDEVRTALCDGLTCID